MDTETKIIDIEPNDIKAETKRIKTELKSRDKKKRKIKRIIAVFIIAFILGIAAAVLILHPEILSFVRKTEPETMQVSVVSTLEEILSLYDLETASIFYNAVAEQKNESGDKTLYYAAYEGTVTAGVDFSEIKIELNEETNVITVTLPKAHVLDCSVDPGTIEYIFVDRKAETESVSQEAYKLCLADLNKRAENDSDNLLETAYENAKRAVEGLFSPWMSQTDVEYSFVIV